MTDMMWSPYPLVWRLLAALWLFCCTSTVFATSPVFVNLPASEAILEDVAVGYTVMTLSATDPDTSQASLTFSLVTNSTQFEVDGQDLKVLSAFDLDVAAPTSVYTLTVRVSDGTTDVDDVVTVAVRNINDETPTITGGTTATVAEEQSIGASLNFQPNADPTATDKDQLDPSVGETITYSLEGDDRAAFHIDPSTGAITTATVLDRETKAVYDQLVFKVADNAEPNHTATVNLTVSVTDMNDKAPSCSSSIYNVTVAENTVAGANLTTLTCSDADDGVNGAFVSSIYSGDPGNVFGGLGSSLTLQTGTTAVDYETHQSFVLVIHLVDTPVSGTPNTGTATVHVTVTGENEYKPTWGTWDPSTVITCGMTISRDVCVGAFLFKASATDNDWGTDGTVAYLLDSVVDNFGNRHAGVFGIDSVTGEVSTLQTLDRDCEVTSYKITVRAKDGGGLSISQTVTVTLKDDTPA